MSKIRLCQIAKAVSEVFGGLVSSFDAIHDAPEPPSIPRERIEYLDGPNYVGSYSAGLPIGRYAYVITYEGNNQRKDAGRIISVVRDANRDKPDMTSMPKTKIVYLDRDNYATYSSSTPTGRFCYEVTYEGNPNRSDYDRTISMRRLPERDKPAAEPEINEDDDSLYPSANYLLSTIYKDSITRAKSSVVFYAEDKNVLPTSRVGVINVIIPNVAVARSNAGSILDFLNKYGGKTMYLYERATVDADSGSNSASHISRVPGYRLVDSIVIPTKDDVVCEKVEESDLLNYIKKNRISSNVVEYVKKNSL